MDHIRVEGVPPYDGRYEFALRGGAFTVREWGWIKRHSGYLPLTWWEGLSGSDAELMAVLAIIALIRAGKVDRDDVPEVWERFADAPDVTVRLEFADAEDDADPSSPESSNGNTGSSGRQFEDEFGELGRDPAAFWDPRLGFFSIPPGDGVGDMTPLQLLQTVDYFHALHGVGDGG